MKLERFKIYCCLLTCCLSFMSVVSLHAQQIIEDSAKVDGKMRRYKMFLPEGLPKDAPLVFVLHGYGNEGQSKTWMNNAAMKYGFALCIPQGFKDLKGKRGWNVGYPSQKGWKQDDVKGMCKLAKIVQSKYLLSKENIFLTGMSNGGDLCYLLSYSNQTTFKAFASLAGLTMLWTFSELKLKRPVPFLEIHGTEDRTSEWFGDLENKGGWGKYLPVPIAVNMMVANNRCTELKVDSIPGLNRENKHYVIRHLFSDLKAHNDVWLYEVVGAPHCWFTDDMDTGEEVWNFFKRYLK